MTGTLLNVVAIIGGSTVGLLFKRNLPRKVINGVLQGIGLVTFAIGIYMFLKSEWLVVVVLAILFGGITGGMLELDKRINRWADKLKNKFKNSGTTFTEGLTTAFLLYCMGALAILGAIDEGLGNGFELLLTKSILDGFSSIALASTLGIGVMFSIIPLFLFQGGITLFAMYLDGFIDLAIVHEVSATGGIILCGLALNILKLANIKIMDLLPSIIYAVIFAYIWALVFI